MKNSEQNPAEVWQELAGRYTQDQQLIKNRWQELIFYYNAPNRHYHTLTHIQELLTLAAKHRDKFQKFNESLFAIFYHDAVYTVGSTHNEEKSARLAELSLEVFDLTPEQLHFISEAILATKKHEKHSDPDINLLLDLDLHILASDWPRYDQYRHQIRQEYGVFPEILFKPKRKKLLQQLLAQPRIYKTNLFAESCENAARKNIQRELSYL